MPKGGKDRNNTAAGMLGTSTDSGNMVLQMRAHCNMESRQSMSEHKEARVLGFVLGVGASHYCRQTERSLPSISGFIRS